MVHTIQFINIFMFIRAPGGVFIYVFNKFIHPHKTSSSDMIICNFRSRLEYFARSRIRESRSYPPSSIPGCCKGRVLSFLETFERLLSYQSFGFDCRAATDVARDAVCASFVLETLLTNFRLIPIRTVKHFSGKFLMAMRLNDCCWGLARLDSDCAWTDQDSAMLSCCCPSRVFVRRCNCWMLSLLFQSSPDCTRNKKLSWGIDYKRQGSIFPVEILVLRQSWFRWRFPKECHFPGWSYG